MSKISDSLTGGLFGLGSTIIRTIHEASQDRINRRRQLEDFKMLAEYNSPLQQMKRYKEAGLNPNLIYGKDGGTVTQMPDSSKNTASLDPTIMSQFAQVASAIGLQNAEKKKILEEARNLKLKNDLEEEALTGTKIESADKFADTSARQQIVNQKHMAYINGYDKTFEEIEKLRNENFLLNEKVQDLKREYGDKTEEGKQQMLKTKMDEFTRDITEAEAKLAKQGIFKGDPIFERKMLQTMTIEQLKNWEFVHELKGVAAKIMMAQAGVALDIRKKKID